MSTSPEDLLNLASSLHSDKNYQNEASKRALVSRAYYSAFHQAKKITYKFLLPESTIAATGSHQKELNKLIQCDPVHSKEHWMTIKSIGVMAARVLNPSRTKADYYLDEEMTEAEAEEALHRARLIESKAKQLFDN